jgi:hypothetical protein
LEAAAGDVVRGVPEEGPSVTESREPPDFGTRIYSFCIAGTQKSGTSTLSVLLDKHRLIQRAPRKEMHFFDDEQRDWSSHDFSDISVPAARAYPQLVGDSTPLYMWWPQALERIRAYNPDMKIIVLFRDPLERLVSQWVMMRNRWPHVAVDWPDFLRRFAPSGLEDRIPEGVNHHAFRMQSGLVRGYYGAQLERGFELFGQDQFHVLEFRAFLRDHLTALDGVTDFLGIHRFRTRHELRNSFPGKPEARGTSPTEEDITYLVDAYRQDFETFKKLSHLDVSHWPLQRVIDGDLEPADLAAQFGKKFLPLED